MTPLESMTIKGWEAKRNFDVVGFIMDFECGDVSEDRMIEGFQHLIDDGTVWQLQGFYGRTAESLIEQGYCHAA